MSSQKATSPNIFFLRYSKIIILGLVLGILCEAIFIIYQYHQSLQRDLLELSIAQAYADTEISDYPVFITEYEPYLTAKSAVILDNTAQRILFSKNPTLRFSMASTTKLMSALTALEKFAYNDVITVKRKFTEGSIVGLDQGEQIYFDDLLYAMLLPSGNDAAYAIADNYPGGLEAFVKRMNEKAREYHLTDTHFQDPAGLNDDQNYTTALDLARFSAVALKDPTVSRVVSTQRKVFTDVSGQKTYDVATLNKLLGVQGVIGIKTGTTEGAGEVLTTAIRNGEKEYIIVVMKSEDRFTDTQSLINLIKDNVSYLNLRDIPPTR